MTRTSAWTRRTFLAAAPAAAALGAGTPRAQAKPDFKIGIIGSVSGPAAAYGREYVEGLEAYVKAWNARGGYNGRKIVTEVFDDETNPVNAINGFRRHVADPKTMLVWCAVGSQTALGIKAIASEYKVPVISGGGVDELGIPADPWFFKVSQGQTDLGQGFIEALQKYKAKTLATLNSTDAIGQADAKKVRELTEKAGIKIVAAEVYSTSDTNFNSQLVRIRNAKADMFWNQATGSPAILVFKQVKQLQIETPMVISFAAVNRAFFQGIGGPEQAEGVLVVIPLGAVAADDTGPIGAMYREVSAAVGKRGTLFHTIAWDTALVAEHAMKNSDGTREGIRAALDKVKDLPAINGPFTFTPQNHVGQDARGLILAKFTKGKWARAQ